VKQPVIELPVERPSKMFSFTRERTLPSEANLHFRLATILEKRAVLIKQSIIFKQKAKLSKVP
jgi:hypothetical protein